MILHFDIQRSVLDYFFVILFLFSSSFIFSQQKVIGKVETSDRQPMDGVLILPDQGEPTYSDAAGEFTLTVNSNVKLLTIKYLGAEDVVLPLVLKGGNIDLGTIIMIEKSTLMNEVNISATALPYKASHEGTNYYISPLQLKKIQPVSTEEVLKTLPGVNVLGDMGLSNRLNVSIRGSWGRRSEKVLLMEDGSPISPAPYTAPGIYYNPVSDRVDAIEVSTGSDVLRYGPNNMFGVINYVTPRPPQEPALRAKISGGQRGYFSSLLSYGGTWHKVGTLVEAVYKKFDGFTQHSAVNMLNLNAKIFAELSETQSIYFKVSSQFEDNQASLSSVTPYMFRLDPVKNPFDAERFTMHRYGLDIIHKWVPNASKSLTTKIFASDFARDWWRQNTIVLQASNAKAYLGDKYFSERYAYLNKQTFGNDDFVRIGSLTNGRESTTDSKWKFSVVTLEETFKKSWNVGDWSHGIEAQVKGYHETYNDQALAADSSRWARSGRFTTDLAYALQSLSGYLRYHVTFKNWDMTPILRVEQVWMNREDVLANAKNPNLSGEGEFSRVNTYSIIQPGISLGYRMGEMKIFGSVYSGYIAPSKYFAFLVERDGVLVNPLSISELSNIKPERSINAELGIRGEIFKNKLNGQLTAFNNRISNFYLAGWNEFFDKLGVINIQGLEATLKWDVLPAQSDHKFYIQPNITLLNSKVISGELVDRQLFSQIKHTTATKQEFVDKVNANPSAYNVYTKNAAGQDVLMTAPIAVSDLDKITKTVYKFGENGITNGRTPYAPLFTYNVTLSYSYKTIGLGISYTHVGDQYAEFANFENESGDGGLGKIKAFQTVDVNFNYDFNIQKSKCTLFIAGKNLADKVFVASRLNRGQSGIMPSGFRQINIGFNILL